jgi:DNA-binding XRE family transcriptional regulator
MKQTLTTRKFSLNLDTCQEKKSIYGRLFDMQINYIYNNIEYLIKEYAKGSSKKFSELTDIPRTTIINWRKKVAQPNQNHCMTLSEKFNISMERLFSEDISHPIAAKENKEYYNIENTKNKILEYLLSDIFKYFIEIYELYRQIPDDNISKELIDEDLKNLKSKIKLIIKNREDK